MTHRRQTIRAAFVTAVTGLVATGARVFPSRVYALMDDELPALRVFTPADIEDGDTIGTGVLPVLRRYRVVCEAVVKANLGADDVCDAICEQVEIALTANPTLSGAVLKLAYRSYDQDLSGEGDRQVVVGRMTFEAIAPS